MDILSPDMLALLSNEKLRAAVNELLDGASDSWKTVILTAGNDQPAQNAEHVGNGEQSTATVRLRRVA